MFDLRTSLTIAALTLCHGLCVARAEAPPYRDYCDHLRQEVQGKKHGFLAGNVSYYVGGFHASWDLQEHETLGLTHPFCHDLRSRGVGLMQSVGTGHQNTGLGNDLSGWEFYKDTHVLYGSVRIGDQIYRHPVPNKMYWRPDRMVCEYEVGGVQIREQKFIALNDAACTLITSSRPVALQFSGQSFFGRHSVASTATIRYDDKAKAIHIAEGGITRCRPETDRSERIGPIMYQGMSTVLAASRDLMTGPIFTEGKDGQREYTFEVGCDEEGVVVAWAMNDVYEAALSSVSAVLGRKDRQTTENGRVEGVPEDSGYRKASHAMLSKTREMNRQLNEEIPWLRCSDRKFEDIYYYLWSLYLMYYIDVGRGWEKEPHTQTAVNNFRGIHRYDATFQIKVGSWMRNKSHYAYGNVLTWKHLFRAGHYRKSPDGSIALSDNKGTTWHSAVYGNELSEHVLGAWQIYQHTGDANFLRDCYVGYFRDVFWERIAPFASNQFEVAEALIEMARLTGHRDDIAHWKGLVSLNTADVDRWFEQRWQSHGIKNFFAGPKNGMMMTNGFWHLRSKHFPREYAVKMVDAWALDRERGYYGKFFPLAMSQQAMKTFATKVDHSFGYTPDTAYFTLSGMFQQQLGAPAWQLTLNHLENFNFNDDWNVPVAPEAYTRSGEPFGDQYSNFNAGKLLLFLEGLAGLEYSVPDDSLIVRDTMPSAWEWMEVRVPMRVAGEQKTRWPVIRYERTDLGGKIKKSIEVSDCPLQVTIAPWAEQKGVTHLSTHPIGIQPAESKYPHYHRFNFNRGEESVRATLHLSKTPD